MLRLLYLLLAPVLLWRRGAGKAALFGWRDPSTGWRKVEGVRVNRGEDAERRA